MLSLDLLRGRLLFILLFLVGLLWRIIILFFDDDVLGIFSVLPHVGTPGHLGLQLGVADIAGELPLRSAAVLLQQVASGEGPAAGGAVGHARGRGVPRGVLEQVAALGEAPAALGAPVRLLALVDAAHVARQAGAVGQPRVADVAAHQEALGVGGGAVGGGSVGVERGAAYEVGAAGIADVVAAALRSASFLCFRSWGVRPPSRMGEVQVLFEIEAGGEGHGALLAGGGRLVRLLGAVVGLAHEYVAHLGRKLLLVIGGCLVGVESTLRLRLLLWRLHLHLLLLWLLLLLRNLSLLLLLF